MADTIGTSFTCPNYSGMLYTKSNTATPFTNSIGGAVISPSVEFVINQTYALPTASQPAISETASLTAPDSAIIGRSQNTNVCQIFHRKVTTSYAHESNMGTLSGVNIAGQSPNPTSELDWQIGLVMQSIANDIEYTFLNGEYNKATSDATINKTRGIITACESNKVDNEGTARDLSIDLIKQLCKSVFNNGGVVDGAVLMMDASQKVALTNLYEGKSGYLAPISNKMFGVSVQDLVTDFGVVHVVVSRAMPAGKILLYNPSVIRPVEMYVPGKGNFFYEPLAKTGAAESGQIFGQIGLDYGPEWFHGVITDLK